MATKTATIDTNEWKYIDSNGIPHTVTNAQTFTFELTDGGADAVTYSIDNYQSITTTDGYTIELRPTADGGNVRRDIHYLADANNATETHNLRGEFDIACPVSGVVQHWRIAKATIDDVDAPTALTSMTFEDQFGNVMNIPNTGGGITVA